MRLCEPCGPSVPSRIPPACTLDGRQLGEVWLSTVRTPSSQVKVGSKPLQACKPLGVRRKSHTKSDAKSLTISISVPCGVPAGTGIHEEGTPRPCRWPRGFLVWPGCRRCCCCRTRCRPCGRCRCRCPCSRQCRRCPRSRCCRRLPALSPPPTAGDVATAVGAGVAAADCRRWCSRRSCAAPHFVGRMCASRHLDSGHLVRACFSRVLPAMVSTMWLAHILGRAGFGPRDCAAGWVLRGEASSAVNSTSPSDLDPL